MNQAQEVISLTGKLLHAYSASGEAVTEVLRIPQFANLTVLNGGAVTAHPWNGATGGVLAFDVAGTLDLEAGGLVTAVGLGFPGGQGGHRVNGNSDPLRNGVQGTGRFGSGGLLGANTAIGL